jgi:hypothetical protein
LLGQRLDKAKKISRRVFRFYHPGWTLKDFAKVDINRLLGIYRKTRVPCSCFRCGNPRRYFNELTIQERRQLEERTW